MHPPTWLHALHAFPLRVVAASLLVAALSWLSAQPIQAADAMVTNCTSDLDLRLKLALMQSSGGGTLTFSCGPAAVTINLTGGMLPPITQNTTLDGAGLITLSGMNLSRLLSVDGGATLALRRIGLTNGYADGDGGAIVNNGRLHIEGSTIRDSTTSAAGNGGAIASRGPVAIIDSTLANNRAGNAGAVYPVSAEAQVRIVNSSLRGNRATRSLTGGQGGAVMVGAGATVAIVGGEVISNTAVVGGGIDNSRASSVTLTDVTFTGNQAEVAGGGIANAWSTLTLTNVTLRDNQASSGGGIENFEATATLTNVTLAGNQARRGGGIRNEDGTATLTNVTLTTNQAEFAGGAMWILGRTSRTNVTLTNVTLAGNHAQSAGGIYNPDPDNAPVALTNVVLADNTGGNCRGAARSASFSLSTDTTCALTGTGNRTNTPALLGPLQVSGGMETLVPQRSSTLIDAGQCALGVTTDQRGVARPQGAACDIGAVEVRPDEHILRVYLPLVIR